LEFIGIWEEMNNPNFKPLEFDAFKKNQPAATQQHCHYPNEKPGTKQQH
jgi:hypothetical protein